MSLRLGVNVATRGRTPERLDIRGMARVAEQAGADGLWVGDHLLTLDGPIVGYPYGQPPFAPETDYYEALVVCSMMAAVTERCRIGTAVLVLPQRNVLEVAKAVVSLDRLSGGRFALGVGAGWYQAEMEALGFPYSSRGRRLDEMLDVLRECWSGRPGAFDGEELRVPHGVVIRPLPAQAPGPPLLVGGMTRGALRRAARSGDGWICLAFADRLDHELLARRLAALRALRGERRPFETVLKLHAPPESASELPAIVRGLAPLGFDEIAIDPPWTVGLAAAAETIAAVRAAIVRQ